MPIRESRPLPGMPIRQVPIGPEPDKFQTIGQESTRAPRGKGDPNRFRVVERCPPGVARWEIIAPVSLISCLRKGFPLVKC